MTALVLDPDLQPLAGGNVHAVALLAGAVEQLSGAELEQHLLTHAQPALFADGLATTMYQAMILEDRVGFFRTYLADQAAIPEMAGLPYETAMEQLKAEVLAPLVALLTGRPACPTCLAKGRLSHVGAVGVEGDCDRHDAKAVAA